MKFDKGREVTARIALNIASPTIQSAAARYYLNAVETG